MGLLDMRTAKAEYIRALKDLRAADAEYTRAKAAVEQANARYRDAETAFKNAQVENQKLLNDLQELWNEAQAQENTRRAAEIAAEIEGIQMQMEELAAKHAIQMVQYEAQLAQAQEGLRVVLRDIAIASKSLSPNEKLAVIESAALVAVLSDAQVAALKEVNEAQKVLDSLTFEALVANTVWDDGFLEGAEEHWQEMIEGEQAKIAIAEIAKALVPLATAQLGEWQDIVEGYAKDSIAIAQEMAQQTYDSTAYINATVKPGIVKFNKAIAEFIEENWETPNMDDNSYKYAEPALTQGQKDTLEAGEPAKTDRDAAGKEVYYSYSGGPKTYVNMGEDTLPRLTGLKSNIWFNKYAYMLTFQEKSYGTVVNPFDDDERMIMAVNPIAKTSETAPDTLVIQGKIKQDMKDFILGKSGDGYLSEEYEAKELTASYGLKGAYDVLTRVYQQAKKDYDTGKIDSLIRITDSTWTAQNAILKAGLKDNAKYKNAINDFEDAVNEYNTRKDNMKKALDKFVEQWNKSVETGAEWSDVDSIAMINAIAEFAAAREEYLEKCGDTIATRGKKGGYQDPRYVYFVKTADPFEIDSVEIKTLDINKIREKSKLAAHTTRSKYEVFGTSKDNIWAESTVHTYGTDPVYTYINDHGVFDHIVKEMLGSRAYALTNTSHTVGSDPHALLWQEINIENIADVFNDGEGENHWKFTGLLFGWKYKAASTSPSLTNGSVVLRVTGAPVNYAEIETMEGRVIDTVKAYVETYNAYWGRNAKKDDADVIAAYNNYFTAAINKATNVNTLKSTAEGMVAGLFNRDLMKNGKLKESAVTDGKGNASYTMEYFKPYGNEDNFVTFGEEPSTFSYDNNWTMYPLVDTTQALLAVLTEIDPFTGGRTNNHYFGGESNILKSAIFFGGESSDQVGVEKTPIPTTAYKALYWHYLKYVATEEEVEKDLEKIAKWISDVEGIFTTNAARTVTRKFEQAKWEKDSTNYVNAVARKKVVDAYLVVKKDFVGTRTEQIGGKDSVVLNDLFIKNNPIDTIKALGVIYKLNTTEDPFESLFAKNLFGEYVGWTDKLAGKQLANAKEAFGEKPYEQIQDWKVARLINEKKQATLSSLKEKAEAVFVEAAKVQGIGDPDSTSLASMQAAWDAYVAEIDKAIEKANNAITGFDYRDRRGRTHHVKGYAEELADVIAGNITWEYLIADAEINLAAAEAKLEDISEMLEKAQSNLDKIMEYIRSTDAEFVIPVTIEEIDAMLKSMKTTFNDSYDQIDIQLKALIAAYMKADED